MDKALRYFPQALFSLYFMKLLVFRGPDISDACVLAILALWSVATEYKLKSEETKAELAKLQELKSQLDLMSKQLDHVKNAIAGNKLNTSRLMGK